MFSKIKPLTAGVFAIVAAPFAIQASASAAPACPTGNSTAVPTGAIAYATIFSTTTPFSCEIGDKLFKDFNSPTGTITTMSVKPSFWWEENVPNQSYAMYFGVPAAAAAFPNGTGGFKFTTKVTQLPYMIIEADLNRVQGNGSFSSSLTGTGPLNEQSYTASYTLTGSTNTRRWSVNLTQDVPAPLPLAGAAMAFGYSRKLRNRVRRLA
jgi:hypothetical protein